MDQVPNDQIPAQDQHIAPEVPETDEVISIQAQKHLLGQRIKKVLSDKKTILWLAGFGLLGIITIGAILTLKPSPVSELTTTTKKTFYKEESEIPGGLRPSPSEPTGSGYEISSEEAWADLRVGFKVAIDKEWDVRVLESDSQHDFLMAQIKHNSKVELEAFSHSLAGWEDFVGSPLIKVDQSENKSIGGHSVKVERGTENFADSKRKVVVAVWSQSDKTLVIRVFSSDPTALDGLFDRLARSVIVGSGETSLFRLKFGSPVFASETVAPPSLPDIDYQLIEVMGEPFEDEITKNDPSYKDGFVKGYRFLAFKSQRLATYAVENRDSNPGSFVKSQLFDSNGQAISTEMGTHTEFKAPLHRRILFIGLFVWTTRRESGD